MINVSSKRNVMHGKLVHFFSVTDNLLALLPSLNGKELLFVFTVILTCTAFDFIFSN